MSRIRADKFVNNAANGAPQLTFGAEVVAGVGLTGAGGINITGVATAGSFSGNVTGTVTGTATGLAGNPSISVTNLTVSGDQTVGGGLTITGNLTVDGTQTIVNTSVLDVADKTVGIASTTNATDTTADDAGIIIYASSATPNNDKSILYDKDVDGFAFSDKVDIKGSVETVSTASTTEQVPRIADRVVVECDMNSGNIFTHDLSSGDVGIVSFKNFAVTKNSFSTYTLILTQKSTVGKDGSASAGAGNTTAATGIGTFVYLQGQGQSSGISTTALTFAAAVGDADAGSASTVTVAPIASAPNLISFGIQYNGSGAGTNTNYKVFVTGQTGGLMGNIRFLNN